MKKFLATTALLGFLSINFTYAQQAGLPFGPGLALPFITLQPGDYKMIDQGKIIDTLQRQNQKVQEADVRYLVATVAEANQRFNDFLGFVYGENDNDKKSLNYISTQSLQRDGKTAALSAKDYLELYGRIQREKISILSYMKLLGAEAKIKSIEATERRLQFSTSGVTDFADYRDYFEGLDFEALSNYYVEQIEAVLEEINTSFTFYVTDLNGVPKAFKGFSDIEGARKFLERPSTDWIAQQYDKVKLELSLKNAEKAEFDKVNLAFARIAQTINKTYGKGEKYTFSDVGLERDQSLKSLQIYFMAKTYFRALYFQKFGTFRVNWPETRVANLDRLNEHVSFLMNGTESVRSENELISELKKAKKCMLAMKDKVGDGKAGGEFSEVFDFKNDLSLLGRFQTFRSFALGNSKTVYIQNIICGLVYADIQQDLWVGQGDLESIRNHWFNTYKGDPEWESTIRQVFPPKSAPRRLGSVTSDSGSTMGNINNLKTEINKISNRFSEALRLRDYLDALQAENNEFMKLADEEESDLLGY